ncbi:MATE family efflux transporter [Cellulomonas denverensis]|uniref:MATE family efflux transporter n=1 Tax=Cellulomonas denverensis TaxID=264297 RepID=A0A7X6KW47_9CELL|nr:MATE family efflux transporter [Cellulomonas denverensis]NKY23331.1 MATE family efflux transporter [Cellulomonas denverensis]GIG24380.1 MATE family efflux transporter [Cellulomonas denverensis]
MAKVLTAGSPWRVILAFAVPLLVGNVVQQLYQFADAVVVGRHLGVDSLAAVGATGSLLFLLLGFAWGMTSGFAIPTAQAFGAHDHAAVRRSVAAGTVLTGAASVVLTVVAPLLAGPALALLRTPDALMAEATTFAQVSFLGAGALMFFNFLSAIIRAIGDSRTPLLFLALSCGLNVALVILLVGPLDLGVGGAALATLLSQAVSVLLCLEFVRRRVPVLHLHRDDWRVTRADLVGHLRLGLPMGFQASIIAIGTLAVQVRLNSLGADAVAAYTTASRVDGLAVALLQSLGLAVSMFVAQNLGGGRPDRIRQGVVQACWIAVGGSAALGVILFTSGSALVRLFVGDQAAPVVELATQFLHLNAALYAVLGVLFVLRGALQGLGHTGVPTLTGAIELVMRVGAAIVLGGAFGFIGVVWGNPLAWAGAVVLLVPAYLRAHRHLARLPVAPRTVDPVVPQPVAVEGPSDGSAVVDQHPEFGLAHR